MYVDDAMSVQKACYKSAGITLGLITTGFVTAIGFCLCAEQNNTTITWDDVKNSYVGLVNEDSVYAKKLLKDNNNGIYEDIINNKIFNKNDIVEYYSAVPYFVQTDNVKREYTKEELSEIIKEFKIGSVEYEYSDEYVKVMK